MVNLDTLAQDIATYRSRYIEDMQDIRWYAEEAVEAGQITHWDGPALVEKIAEYAGITS